MFFSPSTHTHSIPTCLPHRRLMLRSTTRPGLALNCQLEGAPCLLFSSMACRRCLRTSFRPLLSVQFLFLHTDPSSSASSLSAISMPSRCSRASSSHSWGPPCPRNSSASDTCAR